jgi:hypothetical protein
VSPRALAAVLVALLVGGLGRLVLRVSPRVGVRLVRWAVGVRYRQDPERAAMRAEELAALVDERPGRLLKLLTGLGFALHAVAEAGLRSGADRPATTGGRHRVGVAMGVAAVWALCVSLAGSLLSTMLLREGAVALAMTGGVIWAVTLVGALGVARVMGVREADAVGVVVGIAVACAMGGFAGVVTADTGRNGLLWNEIPAAALVPVLLIVKVIKARARGGNRAGSGREDR